MGLSKKAMNKFAKFTATQTPVFKYNRNGPAGDSKNTAGKAALLERIRAAAPSAKKTKNIRPVGGV